MDASQVMASMNNTWTDLIDKYYDHIADEYIQWMAKEYNLSIDELKKKAEPVKERILAGAQDAITASASCGIKKKPPSMSSIKAAASKANTEASENGSSIYAKMSRKELIDKSKEHSLPVKRKNLDMINALVDATSQQVADSSSVDELTSSLQELSTTVVQQTDDN